ncbi:MAG: ABC transporter permease [Clostridiales bacterium]|nr:ABC transporter permease [Clostridiales bacterium]
MFKKNPVYFKESTISVRIIKTSLLITGFNAVLAIISFLVFYSMIYEGKFYGIVQYSSLLNLYSIMVYIEFAMFILIIPAITASGITGEKERKTFDLLLSSKMKPRDIILGKIESSLNMVRILAFSSFPILTLAMVYGGIRLRDLFFVFIYLIISSFFVGSIGIFFSSISNKTTSATALTYVCILFIFVGTYGIVYFVNSIMILQIEEIDIYKGIGGWFYILLINPAISFLDLISSQISNISTVEELSKKFGLVEEGFVFKYWRIISITLQVVFSLLLLWISSRIIDPLKKK